MALLAAYYILYYHCLKEDNTKIVDLFRSIIFRVKNTCYYRRSDIMKNFMAGALATLGILALCGKCYNKGIAEGIKEGPKQEISKDKKSKNK